MQLNGLSFAADSEGMPTESKFRVIRLVLTHKKSQCSRFPSQELGTLSPKIPGRPEHANSEAEAESKESSTKERGPGRVWLGGL